MFPLIAAAFMQELSVEGNCIHYTNYLQASYSDTEIVVVNDMPVTMKFARGHGDNVDTLEVWDSPQGYYFSPPYLTLEENETGVMCLMPYNGA